MSALSNSRTIQWVPINDVRPYPNNPFRCSKKVVRKIGKHIRQHGQVLVIPVTSDLTIIGFEEWWLAAKEEGKLEVRVEIMGDLSPAETDTLRLFLGRYPQDLRQDLKRLRAELTKLKAEGIDLDLTGFEPAEIDFALEIDMPRANVIENIDDVPKRQDRAVSKLGDTFQLSDHLIGCGDARDQGFLHHLCSGREAQACISDFPYNLHYSQFGFGKSRHRHGDFVEASGEMSDTEFYSLLHAALKVLQCITSRSGLLYIFMDWRHILELTAAGKQLGLPLLNLCVWAKANGGMGGLYRSAHELCAVFKAGNEPHPNNVELGKYGRNRLNLWSGYPAPTNQQLLGGHPTVKPVAMLADIMRDCTKRDDLVIDSFLGSGSTLIAAEETQRICVGVELDPYYVDVTIRRWQAITGRNAIHLGTGQPFDDMAQHFLALREGTGDGI